MSLILSDEQIEKIVNDWVNEDWSVRSIQLDRGHWEYIAPIIAQAQLDYLASMTPEKVREEIAKICYQYSELIDDKDIDQRWYELSNRERWFDCADTICAFFVAKGCVE